MRRRKSADLPPPTPVADVRELARLSARELEVLALASGGYLDKQIAAFLGITPNTLRTYWTRIRGKLGEASRGALVALYVTQEASASALNPIEGATWHIDVDRNLLVFYGDRGLFPQGEVDLESAMERYHPDDRGRVRELLRAVIERDMPPFIFTARVVTPRGVEIASAYVESVRDGGGRTVRIVGRHVPVLDLSVTPVAVGGYRRDLQTGVVTVDEGFRTIFRLRPDEPDLFAAIHACVCPDYREGITRFVPSVLADGTRSRVMTLRLCLDDGDRWVSAQVRLEYDGDRPAYVVATILSYL